MPTVQKEIVVPADEDAVWDALTDEDLRREWLHDADDPREIVDEVAGEDEERRTLEFRWARPGEPETSVRFTVEAVPAGTRVVVVESAPFVARWSTALPLLAATAGALCAA